MAKATNKVPARNPQARENELINLAVTLAEQKLRDGTAPAQIITHFLKLATVREQLENEKLRSDLEVAKAKIKQIDSQQGLQIIYENAIAAMKNYSGIFSGEEVDNEDVSDIF